MTFKHADVLALLLVAALPCAAQELEPRAYANLPIGLNFAVAGYARSQGGLATDPSLPVDDAHLEIDTLVLAYVRSLDLWGKSGKVDLILPYSQLAGTALVSGQPAERSVSGTGDLRLRLSANLYGAPALTLKDFALDKKDLVLGASVQLTAPTGQYDSTKVINLGSNRWSLKLDAGGSKSLPPFTLDLTAGATWFTRNDDYFGSQTLEQATLYSTQANLSWDFGGGWWTALGATYYWGGRTRLNGVEKDDELANSRFGLTLAVPVDRRNSVKFNLSSGISTRTGTSFDAFGLAWQYRWGGGL